MLNTYNEVRRNILWNAYNFTEIGGEWCGCNYVVSLACDYDFIVMWFSNGNDEERFEISKGNFIDMSYNDFNDFIVKKLSVKFISNLFNLGL